MDRTTWLTIVIVLAAYACKLSEAHCGSLDCPCPPNRVCEPISNKCKPCFCKPQGDCYWDTTTYTTECDCPDDYYGRYCECMEPVCPCKDRYGFKYPCNTGGLIDDYKIIPYRKLTFPGSGVPSVTYSVANLQACKLKCKQYGCTAISWKHPGNSGNTNRNCEVFKMQSFIINAGESRNNSNWDSLLRECDNCMLPP